MLFGESMHVKFFSWSVYRMDCVVVGSQQWKPQAFNQTCIKMCTNLTWRLMRHGTQKLKCTQTNALGAALIDLFIHVIFFSVFIAEHRTRQALDTNSMHSDCRKQSITTLSCLLPRFKLIWLKMLILSGRDEEFNLIYCGELSSIEVKTTRVESV